LLGYDYVPLAINVYWTLLTILDPLAILLLLFFPFPGMALSVLIMITDLIFTLTDLIINKGVPASAVLQLLFFKLPAILTLTFPVTTLFGTAMALGRFSSDNEMVALRTSGVSLFRISVPIVAISLRSPSKNFRIPSRAILSPLQN
jgi:lipopolysaccharide export LptBFGC system permease protein LptF